MRRFLEAVSLLALAFLFAITAFALYGSYRLTGPIPTHFNATGKADAFGSPQTLLILPAVALILYAVITAISRFPNAFNYPVRVTTANRDQLRQLALNMIAWLKAETILLFTLLQHHAVDAARTGRNTLPGILMPAALSVLFATIAIHVIAMRRLAPRRR